MKLNKVIAITEKSAVKEADITLNLDEVLDLEQEPTRSNERCIMIGAMCRQGIKVRKFLAAVSIAGGSYHVLYA